MAMAAQRQMEHIGETHPMKDHDHDLIQELNERVDSVWRYDQYIANAEGKSELQECWRQLKKQDLEVIEKLRGLVHEEVKQNCF